jgi:hypothetical protein
MASACWWLRAVVHRLGRTVVRQPVPDRPCALRWPSCPLCRQAPR